MLLCNICLEDSDERGKPDMHSLNFKVQGLSGIYLEYTCVSQGGSNMYSFLFTIIFLQVGPNGNPGARAPRHVGQVMARDVNNVQ